MVNQNEPDRPRPTPAEQVALRAALGELVPALSARAAKLAFGLRPPRPAPHDLVNEAVRRMLEAYRDDVVRSARPLAFTVLARVVCDVARGYKFDGGLIEDDTAIEGDAARPRDPMFARVLASLPDRERQVLIKVELDDLAVPEAFVACGWETKSPYHEYKKLIANLRARLEEST